MDGITRAVQKREKLEMKEVNDRLGYIGGSDAGVVLGVNPYKTRYALWAEKTGQTQPPDLSDNNAVRWGTKLEQFVSEEYEMRTGEKLRRDNLFHVHPNYDFIGAHLDRRVNGKKKLVEIKTATSFSAKEFGTEGTAEVPLHYLAQCAHYMAVTDVDQTDLVVALLDKRDIKIYTIDRDEHLEKVLLEKEASFWELVLSNTAPKPQTLDDINQMYREANQSSIVAPPEVEEELRELAAIKEELKDMKKQAEDKEKAIKAYLANNEILTDVTGKKIASWKNQTSRRFDSKAFRDIHPDLFEAFSKQGESRVFRLH